MMQNPTVVPHYTCIYNISQTNESVKKLATNTCYHINQMLLYGNVDLATKQLTLKKLNPNSF